MPQPEPTRSQSEGQKTEKRGGCTAPTSIVLLVLLFAGVSLFAAWMVQHTILLPYESRIYPNVYVLGENLGGFTVEEARDRLRQAFDHYDSGDLILNDGDRTWRIPWSEAGMELDPEATAREAFAVGRGEGRQTLLSLWLGEHGGGTTREVAPLFTIDADATRRALESLAPELGEAPTDASLWLDGDRVMTAPSKPGRAMDVEATAEKVVDTVTHLGPDYPFAPTYRPLTPQVVDVEGPRATVEDLLAREIQVTAQGEHEGQMYSWDWTLGRETIAAWLQVERIDGPPGFAVDVDQSAVEATVERLAAEPEVDGWGFPTERVVQEVWRTFEAGGGTVTAQLTPPPRIYVVQSGDRLTTIADRFGIPPGLIAELNQGVDLNQLHIGQELTIPPQDVLKPYETVEGKEIVISIREQRLRAYEDGQLLYDWLCSTGKDDSPTYRGHFQILSKEEMAYASQWDLQMPHFLGIYRAGGDAVNGIHALPILSSGQRLWAGNLGSRASFGCIILGIEEGEILFDWAELGVPVTIE